MLSNKIFVMMAFNNSVIDILGKCSAKNFRLLMKVTCVSAIEVITSELLTFSCVCLFVGIYIGQYMVEIQRPVMAHDRMLNCNVSVLLGC